MSPQYSTVAIGAIFLQYVMAAVTSFHLLEFFAFCVTFVNACVSNSCFVEHLGACWCLLLSHTLAIFSNAIVPSDLFIFFLKKEVLLDLFLLDVIFTEAKKCVQTTRSVCFLFFPHS